MKNKYTTLTALLLTTLTTGGISTAKHVQAATDGASMKSIGTIEYVQDTDPVNPVDPINPDPSNPITPDDPGDHDPSTNGPLSIDYVSNIRFGQQKTTGTDKIYWAALDKVTDTNEHKKLNRPNFVQVTDKRGSNAGWHLTVTEDKQFLNGTDSLEGAVLKLDNATLSSPDEGNAPDASQAIELVPGVASDVMNAAANKGTGTWLDRFGNDEAAGEKSISLFVPGKSKKVQGEYKTSLTWTLTDSPL